MNILVCHDGSSRAQRALEETIKLFKPYKPIITLLVVAEEPLGGSYIDEEIFNKWKQDRHKVLKEKADYVVKQGLDVDAILAVGDPRKMITKTVAEKKPDMAVVAKRGEGGVDAMVLGSVSAYLIRHVTCPVLVLHT